MEETLFQKIISGEIPADRVYETDRVLAFLDINPVHPGHTLVIPKHPTKDIHDLREEDAGALMQAIITVSNAVKKTTGAPGINVTSNNGTEAGQEVFHLHFHIIPRFDKTEFARPPHHPYGNDEERAAMAEKIAGMM